MKAICIRRSDIGRQIASQPPSMKATLLLKFELHYRGALRDVAYATAAANQNNMDVVGGANINNYENHALEIEKIITTAPNE